MVKTTHQLRVNEIPGQTIFSSKYKSADLNSTKLTEPCLEQKQNVSYINRNPIFNGKTRNGVRIKTIPTRLLENNFDFANGNNEVQDLYHEPIYLNEFSAENTNIQRTKPQHDLYSSYEDDEDCCELNKRINNHNDLEEMSCPKSTLFLPSEVQQNGSLSMKDYCDSEFDVKRDELCQISYDFRYKNGIFSRENLECAECSHRERNMSLNKARIYSNSDCSNPKEDCTKIHQRKKYLHNEENEQVSTISPQSSQCYLFQKENNIHGLRNIVEYNDPHKRGKFNPKIKNSINSSASSLSLPILMLCWIYLLSGNYMLTSWIPLSAASSVNDCRGVRYAYLAKGLDLKDVPRQPRQGMLEFEIVYCIDISNSPTN